METQGPPPGPGESPSWLRPGREALLIALLALVINLAGNGSRGLWDRDEPRYGGCTREMRQSGDYIHPTFNAEPRYHKPILIYWLMLAGTALAGDNPFGARLAPALAGVGGCVLAWALGRRLFGPRAGRLAALMLATAPIFAYNAKVATTDAALTFFLLACQLALWELSRAPSRRWAAGFWVALSLATLTKGPVGPVFLALGGVLSWWWGGPTACWRRLHYQWGVPLFLGLTAPWFIAIALITRGEFYQVSMGYHVVRRMTEGIETHGGFPGYYVALTLVTFYPWSALLPAAAIAAWARRKNDPAIGFVLGWAVGPLVFLELVRTKLIHYYLPSYPACALLAAWVVDRVAASEVNLRRWPLGRVSVGLLAGIGLTMTVGLLALAVVVPWPVRWPCLLMAAVIGPGTLYATDRLQAGATERAGLGLVATWAAAMLLMFGWFGPAVDRYRITPRVARGLAELSARHDAAPVMFGFKPPGVVWELGRPVPELNLNDDLSPLFAAKGSIVAALKRGEIEYLRRAQRLEVEVRDVVHGVDTENPLKDEPLHLALIRPGSGAERVAAGRQQPQVK